MTSQLGLAVRGVLGRGVGVAVAPAVFVVSAARRARAVHAEGLVCRAEVVGVPGTLGARLTGPALARFSGAFADEGAPAPDILGLALRFQQAGDAPRDGGDLDVTRGDQDLLTATFRSFRTASQDRASTDVTDYLSPRNTYRTVAPWRVRGEGVAQLALQVANSGTPPPPGRGTSRRERLAIDIAQGRAALALTVAFDGDAPTEVAEIRLFALVPGDGRTLRESLRRTGRGLVADGFRNGIRRVVYPVSQTARRLVGA